MVFGDEIEIRARTLTQDSANPLEVIRDAASQVSAGRSGLDRLRAVLAVLAGGRAFAERNFATGCEVADVLVDRLGVGAEVQASLRHTFERWNGKGFPNGTRGEAIPLPMRIVHLTHDLEALARLRSPDDALATVRERAGRTYDPTLVDAVLAHGPAWLDELDRLDPWDAVLDAEPVPHRVLTGSALDDALTVAADFVDLKSPFLSGHSRRCAELADGAARHLGLDPEERDAIRRAALLHDLGITAVPNSIWDKPGALTRAEHDRVELHPLLTEQMLRRSPALAALAGIASAHHERPDGAGYHRRQPAARFGLGACVLAAADTTAALLADRPHRDARTTGQATDELHDLVRQGALEGDAVDAVLQAAGLGGDHPTKRREHPAGLTDREVEVLRLAARGLTTRVIAERLYISPKTADRHIQNVYAKIGVSTRGAAALWTMEHGVAV